MNIRDAHKRLHHRGLLLVLLTLCFYAKPACATDETPVHMVRFTDYEDGSIDDWLEGKGSRFEHEDRNRNRIDFDVESNELVREAKRIAFDIVANETVSVPTLITARMDSGANRFSSDASSKQGAATKR